MGREGGTEVWDALPIGLCEEKNMLSQHALCFIVLLGHGYVSSRCGKGREGRKSGMHYLLDCVQRRIRCPCMHCSIVLLDHGYI